MIITVKDPVLNTLPLCACANMIITIKDPVADHLAFGSQRC